MLAAWIRMKYPNVVDGSVAMSAPIYYFQNRKDLDYTIFFNISTINFAAYNASDYIREGYARINYYIENPDVLAYSVISEVFNLCDPIINSTGMYDLRTWLDNAYTYMAMLNYPEETTFLKHLPAWPANTSASHFSNFTKNHTQSDLFFAMKMAAEVYYNWDGKLTCNDIFSDHSSDEDMSGWNIQACSDMCMPMWSNGKTDMFYP